MEWLYLTLLRSAPSTGFLNILRKLNIPKNNLRLASANNLDGHREIPEADIGKRAVLRPDARSTVTYPRRLAIAAIAAGPRDNPAGGGGLPGTGQGLHRAGPA